MAFMSWFRKNSICVIVKHNWQGCPITVCTFWVPCCDVRYDFRIKTMFGSSLPPVVCRRAHVLFTLLHIVLCFCFIFFIVCTLLSSLSGLSIFLLPLRYSLTFIVIKHGTVCLAVHPFSFYFLLVQCRQSFC